MSKLLLKAICFSFILPFLVQGSTVAGDIPSRESRYTIDRNKSLAPTSQRRISIDTTPSYFAYIDNTVGDKSDELATLDKWLSDMPFKCLGRSELSGKKNRVIFHNLPVGRNIFSISCTGHCEDVKYSVSSASSIEALHLGLRQGWPMIFTHMWTPGPPLKLLFKFFEDEPGAPKDRVVRIDEENDLPPNTRVVVVHSLNSDMTIFSDHSKCSHAPPTLDNVSHVKLSDYTIGFVGHASMPGDLRMGRDREVMSMLLGKNQKIIECMYGLGNNRSRRYVFWYQQVPDEIYSVLREDLETPYRALGVKAVEECPHDMAEAAKMSRAAIDAIPADR